VQRRDVPIYLTGLGTVQAYNSVLVKPRVDGQIVKINFTEGKDVRAGEVVVEIDPRAFEAALSQAQANSSRKGRSSDTARLDLCRVTSRRHQRDEQTAATPPAHRWPSSVPPSKPTGVDRHGAQVDYTGSIRPSTAAPAPD
jgi:multidrug efflux system membrane fusion protein